jgi:hypothetical protein
MYNQIQRSGLPFEGDSWSNWEPDPERAFREHNAALEPYALMTREEILDCMRNARGGKEWEFLWEFFLDKCVHADRGLERTAVILTSYLELGLQELCFVESTGLATRIEDGGIQLSSG